MLENDYMCLKGLLKKYINTQNSLIFPFFATFLSLNFDTNCLSLNNNRNLYLYFTEEKALVCHHGFV